MTFLRDMMECLSIARTPRKLIFELGFQDHPSCCHARTGWDKMYRKVVYHSDPHTLFHAPRPDVRISPGDDGQPPGAALPLPPPAEPAPLADAPPGSGARGPGDAAAPQPLSSAASLNSMLKHKIALAFLDSEVSRLHARRIRRPCAPC